MSRRCLLYPKADNQMNAHEAKNLLICRCRRCVSLEPTLEPYHTAGAVLHHSKFRWPMSALPPKADIG